jgi:predicted Zn-dependent protease
MDGSRTLRAALVALAVAACDSPVVGPENVAYNPSPPPESLTYHWPLGKTLSIYVDPTGVPAGADLAATVRHASMVWASVIYYREFDFRFSANPSDADVIVHYGTAPLLVDTLDCNRQAETGVTFFCNDGNVIQVLPLLSGAPGRVKMDVSVSHPPAGGAEAFRAIVAHEFGHVVGIGGHSPDAQDLMFGAPAVTAPTERDARTLRTVLHLPSALVF